MNRRERDSRGRRSCAPGGTRAERAARCETAARAGGARARAETARGSLGRSPRRGPPRAQRDGRVRTAPFRASVSGASRNAIASATEPSDTQRAGSTPGIPRWFSSVRSVPGATQLQRTPLCAPSSAIALVSAMTAALERLYAADPDIPESCAAVIAETLTIRRAPRRSASRETTNALFTLTATISSKVSTAVSATEVPPFQLPAQLAAP